MNDVRRSLGRYNSYMPQTECWNKKKISAFASKMGRPVWNMV